LVKPQVAALSPVAPSRDAWWEEVFFRQDGKWEVRKKVFKKLADAFRFGEVVYYRERADELEAATEEAGLCY
jgi:hypothetical protein